MLRTIGARQMRSINRAAVLQFVRLNSPTARSEISRKLHLSLPTVMRIVDELMAEGIVRATGVKQWSSGRRRELLEYYKDGQAVIGVDLGGTKLFGAVANIGGDILSEISIACHGSTDRESFEKLASLVGKLLKVPLKEGQKVRGIGVGAPGIMGGRQGIVGWAPSLNWRDFPLKEKLEARFHLPTAVENDVNLAALGENWFGVGQGCTNMVLIAVGTGVGAGIIADGALYRGQNQSAGEVGYMVTQKSALGRCYDRFGALESAVSGTGVAERARTRLAGKRAPKELKTLTSIEVFEAARSGEAWARRIVDETVDDLSMAIANISAVLDPELVILGGGVASSADLLVDPILARIRGVLPHVPQIKASNLGYRAGVMGAIAQTIYMTTDYYIVRKLS